MAVITPIIDLVHICAQLGVQDAVLCPGSRSAALTIAFSENPDIQCLSIQDERSAAYIALGIAQNKNKPVVLVCTSGTAALNFAPAVAEAFFLEIPLLVFTADRPHEWIHQYDGQTIFQQNMYGQHVKRAYQWQADYEHPDTKWMCRRTASEAVQVALALPRGPVHINIPIREPFYPLVSEYPLISTCVPVKMEFPSFQLSEYAKSRIKEIFDRGGKVLIAIGQQDNAELSCLLKDLAHHFVVLGDSISQIKGEQFILLHDHYLGVIPSDVQQTLQPDLLITTEKSFVSKPFKQFIRANPPNEHWHIQVGNHLKDPFQTLTWHIDTLPVLFFKEIKNNLDLLKRSVNVDFYQKWMEIEARVKKTLIGLSTNDVREPFLSEADFVSKVLDLISFDTYLHVGNSLSIRYVNLFYGLSNFPFVFCNRGTSGIDGCVSTAVGAAIASPNIEHICIVGDISFLYDSNALWQNKFPPNLKILVLNNQGGSIFGMIPGPTEQPSYSAFFHTSHVFRVEGIASNFHIPYTVGMCETFSAGDLENFLKREGTGLLEFVSNAEQNKKVGNQRKAQIAQLFS